MIADVDPTRIALGIAIGWAVVMVLFVACWKVFKDREHERERMYEGSRMADVLDRRLPPVAPSPDPKDGEQ